MRTLDKVCDGTIKVDEVDEMKIILRGLKSLLMRFAKQNHGDRLIVRLPRCFNRDLEAIHLADWSDPSKNIWFFKPNADRQLLFRRYYLPALRPHIAELERQISAHNFSKVVEIGTGSGYLLNILSNRIKNVDLVGVDLCKSQVDDNSERFPGIDWICADAKVWIPTEIQGAAVFVVNGGVFEYFSPDSLVNFFLDIRRNCHGSMLAILMEPVAAYAAIPYCGSLLAGRELSWSHDYRGYLERSGFQILYERRDDISSGFGFCGLSIIAI